MRKLLYIDLFCGAGGTSTGVNSARYNGEQCAEVIACVNHDKNAIASHASNHPTALHFTEDIRTLELTPLIKHLQEKKKNNPGAFVVLWALLECTNFSKAKGGQPRDADSRTLAEHLFRYIEALNPDYIQIENVEEFMSWGKIDENGRPISKDKGNCYLRWVRNVKSYGYEFSHRILNAADYGAYTSRKRFFGIFARKGLPIVFPEQTHCKGGLEDLFGRLEKWKPVKEVLDFNDQGTSIFREKPLSEKTLERIYSGLIKFVAGGKEAFSVRRNSIPRKRRVRPQVSFLSKQFGGHPGSKNISVEGPAGTITTIDHHALVTTSFIANEYSGGGQLSDINTVSPAILTKPKRQLVSVCRKPWIMDTGFNNVGSSIDEPSRVITANRKWHYLMNPQFASAGGSVDKPCFTLIAKMDKRPPYLITSEEGAISVEVCDSDSPMTKRIKDFMTTYGIVDIKMRMLRIHELKKIMGFPADYVLVGTQAEQKKYIGNAVEVNMARVLCECLSKNINQN